MNGKKLLVLGGTHQQCKIVRAAKELGAYTIVTDYLADSPAKLICDKAYNYNIKDVESIVAMCKEENVDGVIAAYIDPCQRPYNQICDALNLPCYGTSEQFFKMTDKHAFKQMCFENGVGIIPEYSQEDIEMGKVEFPVFVKPVDSRGSRGQAVCYSYEELKASIECAKQESSNGDVLIEKYMGDAHEFQVTYYFVNGIPYLIRTVDSYTGSEENHLEKVVACAVSPSQYTDVYIATTHEKVVRMFQKLGIKDGPIFMQGFESQGEFYFFDPGLRFPGVDYELVYQATYDVDLMKLLVTYALTGKSPKVTLPEDGVRLKGARAAVWFPTLKAGTVKKIKGEDSIRRDPHVISYLPRCYEGERIEWTYNVNQRFAEVDILASNTEELKNVLKNLQEKVSITDTNGNEMVFEKFDVSRIR